MFIDFDNRGNGGGQGGSNTELKPVSDLPVSAETGTVVATTDGLYQFADGEWKKIESGQGGDEPVFLTMNEEGTGVIIDTEYEKLRLAIVNEGSVDKYKVILTDFNHKSSYNLKSATIKNREQWWAVFYFDGYVFTTNADGDDFKKLDSGNTFVITMNEETGELVATGFNAAYRAAGGNLTVLLNVGDRVVPAKEIRVGIGGYVIDFPVYGDFDVTGEEEVIMPLWITENDLVMEQPLRRMTITEAFDNLDRYATRIVPIKQSQYDAMPESRIQPDTLYIIID